MSKIFDTTAHKERNLDTRNYQLILKRLLDIGSVSLALIAFLPLITTLAVLMVVMQGRPVLIRHKRVGRNGKEFKCLKLRTMVVNGDEVLQSYMSLNPSAALEWKSSRKIKDDPRVTPLGRVLRKSSMDELPQLINVLRGEMSLVGPRPIVLEEVHHYGVKIQHYHSVRPGLTGLWQVSGRSNLSYQDRVQMDTAYVSNWTLRSDALILCRTVPAVLASKGSC